MGASKREYEETHLIEVQDNYYKEHLEMFEDNTRHVKIIIKDSELFKDDEIHKGLVKEYIKHKKALRDYEFNKRHNQIQ